MRKTIPQKRKHSKGNFEEKSKKKNKSKKNENLKERNTEAILSICVIFYKHG